MQEIQAIITGATGMVGKGVLLECLRNPAVTRVLVVNRRPLDVQHPKLRELVHPDFYDLSAIEAELQGYNACYFCLGTSAFRMKEADYHRVTYDLTLHVAATLLRLNPGIIFCYVSGQGTDGTEKGRLMWARVKGKPRMPCWPCPSATPTCSGRVSSSPWKASSRARPSTTGFTKWSVPCSRCSKPCSPGASPRRGPSGKP